MNHCLHPACASTELMHAFRREFLSESPKGLAQLFRITSDLLCGNRHQIFDDGTAAMVRSNPEVNSGLARGGCVRSQTGPAGLCYVLLWNLLRDRGFARSPQFCGNTAERLIGCSETSIILISYSQSK